ncbi:hypothetical protein VP14_195 [Vibrio phage VPMCC14]|nr:hypothetical protein VP14_195 [Vibrio phage VPMCC14]
MKELIYSTQTLQIESLCEYARSLGYVPRDVEMIGRGFELVCHNDYHSSKNISFQDMVQLHDYAPCYMNSKINRTLGLTNKYLKVQVAKLQFAMHNKLVESVKLQYDSKSYGCVKVQSNKVKLTEKGRQYCKPLSRYDFLLED